MPNEIIHLVGYEQKRPYALSDNGFTVTGPTQTTLYLLCKQHRLTVQVTADMSSEDVIAFLRESVPLDEVHTTVLERLTVAARYIDEKLRKTVNWYSGYDIDARLEALTFRAALTEPPFNEKRREALADLIDTIQTGRSYVAPYIIENTMSVRSG
jgi:hypothetical protein